MLVEIKTKLKEIAEKFLSTESKIEEVEKKSIKVVAGTGVFPQAGSGYQGVSVTFPEELPTVPIYVGVVWDDVANGIVAADAYVGEICLVNGYITNKGFLAQTYRSNGTYSWAFRWIAFYYDK